MSDESGARKTQGPRGGRAHVAGAAALTSALLLSLGVTARADDWPSQGFDFSHQGATAERSGARFHERPWTAPLEDAGWGTAAPALADGVVVIGARDGSVHALDARSGRRLWRFEAKDSVMASPAIHKGRVFVAALDGTLYALRLADGTVVWKKYLGGLQRSAPTIIEDSVVVAGGFPLHQVFRIDTANGGTIWEGSPGVMAQFSNAAAVSDGKQVVIGTLEGHYYSFDLASGAHRWTYEAGGIVNLSTPVIANGRAYMLPGGDSGLIHAVELATGKAVAGWPVELAGPGDDATVAGKRLSRQQAVSSLSEVSGRLIFDVRFDDALDDNGDGEPDHFLLRESVMAVSADDGHLLWQRKNGRQLVDGPNDVPKNWLCPTPALYPGIMGSARGDSAWWVAVPSTLRSTVEILDSGTGTHHGGLALSGPSRISPVLANGQLMAVTDGGVVHAFLSDANRPPAAPTFTGGTELQVSSVAPVVHWAAALDPDGDPLSYQVRADSDGEVLESWQSELTTGVGETQARLPRDLQPGLTYLVALRARDSRGAWSVWSSPQTLHAVQTPTVSSGGIPQTGLAAALLGASPGDVIRLGAGTFHLTETIRVPAGVSLAGAGPRQTIVDASGRATGISLEGTIEGQPTAVKGLTIKGAGVGIAVHNARNARIANVIVRDNQGSGIEVDASGSAMVTNATLVANGRAVRSFGTLTIENSLVVHNQSGWVADPAGAVVSRFNDVFANGVGSQGMAPGTGDVAQEVEFVDFAGRDLRLGSPQPSTDRGDPTADFAAEPVPNGSRINLGAYGGTAEAELSAAPPPPSTASPTPTPASTPPPAEIPTPTPDTPAAVPTRSSGGCSVAAIDGRHGGRSDSGPAAPILKVLGALVAVTLFRRRRRRAAAVASAVLLPCMTHAPPVLALNCTWNGSGGTGGQIWSNATRWTQGGSGGSTACPPVTTDDVAVFDNGSATCDIASSITVGSIALNSGYTGTLIEDAGQTITTLGSFTQAAATFTGGNGQISLGGDLVLSAGNFTATSALMDIGGAFTKTGGVFTHNGGQVMLRATSNQVFASNGATFNNLTINDGLLGYWKLNESATPSLDSSGYGLGATWVSSPLGSATVPTVNFTDARSLGIDSAGDYATFTSPPSIVFTITAWIKVTAISSVAGTTQRILELPGASLYLNNSAATAPDNPSSLGFAANRATTAGEWRSPASSLGIGAWTHVAVTYDASSTTNAPVLYINGVSKAVSVKTTAVGGAISNAGAAYIGNRAAADSFFNGLIDELRIYNRALTSAEINSLAIGNQPGTGVATQTLTGSPSIAGDLVLATGTLSTATNDLTVGGNWWNYGGLFATGGSGNVTFNGSSATSSILSAGQLFENLTINGTGTWTLADRLETSPSRSITTTAGTLNLSSRSVRTGDINRNGAVTIAPATSLVILDSDASQVLDTGTFNNLQLEPVKSTNLVGYWKLDEGQGKTTRDYSGNGNTGTLVNGPNWGLGVVPSDYSDVVLDGTNDHVTLGTTNLPAVGGAITVSMFVTYASVGAATRSFVTLKSASGTLQIGFLGSAIKAWKTGSVPLVTASSTPASGFAYVAYTFDGTTHTLYVNGVSATSTVTADAGAVTAAYLGTSDGTAQFFAGHLNDVRVYNTALTSTQIQAFLAASYPPGLTGAPTYTLGAATTVGGTFSQVAGGFDSSTFTMNLSLATPAASVSSGTYTVGSSSNTFAGGLTVGKAATLVMATSGGTVKVGSTKTLIIDGTLNASNAGASIQTAGAVGTFYGFSVGSSAAATPVLNISGLTVKNTNTSGMYINAVPGSLTTFTRFDNIAFSAGTGLRLLQIYAPTLYLVASGCSFDAGVATGTTTSNVTLRGDGSATETRLMFGNATCLNGSAPTYGLCEGKDDDDDSGSDGVGDTVATNGAVIQWVHSAETDISGTIEGFPTAAFDWSTFAYYSTYVLYHDVGGGTADRLYVRSTDGNPQYFWDGPSGVDFIGAPRFDTVSSTHYVYVATTTGKVYRLIDNGTSSLVPDSSGSWTGANNPFDCGCVISTPLSIDSTNIYWGGVVATVNKIWTLDKTARTLATTSPVSGGLTLSAAAPAIWVDSTPHTQMFLGSASHYYKLDINAQSLTTDSTTCATGTVNGRLSILASQVYGADSAGSLCVLDAATFSATAWSYHDNTNHSGCASGSTCAITGSLYVDPLLARVFYGDSDGHLYASYSASGTGTQMAGFPYRPGSASELYGSAPLYNAGVLVAGTTTGNVYVIDVNGGSGPVLQQTYKLGTATKISGIGYDTRSGAYMIASGDPTNKDGRLFYIDRLTDPTPAAN